MSPGGAVGRWWSGYCHVCQANESRVERVLG
jgi:hypothetical protein